MFWGNQRKLWVDLETFGCAIEVLACIRVFQKLLQVASIDERRSGLFWELQKFETVGCRISNNAKLLSCFDFCGWKNKMTTKKERQLIHGMHPVRRRSAILRIESAIPGVRRLAQSRKSRSGGTPEKRMITESFRELRPVIDLRSFTWLGTTNLASPDLERTVVQFWTWLGFLSATDTPNHRTPDLNQL